MEPTFPSCVASLLAFNVLLSLLQESRSQANLAALKSRLALFSSVRRNGGWMTISAAELVVIDVVKLSLGGEVAADVRICLATAATWLAAMLYCVNRLPGSITCWTRSFQIETNLVPHHRKK